MIRHSRHHHIDSTFLYGLAIISIFVLVNISKPLLYLRTSIYSVVTVEKVGKKELFDKTAFENLNIKAKAYVVYDIVDGKIIASKNATTTLPLASVSKIMMAITAYTHYDADRRITITPESIDGGYDLGLKNGQTWTLGELLKYTLVFSSNDGAQAIADKLAGRREFVALMNSDAKALGLDMHFTHPAGLDVDGKIGGLGSALDVAQLFSIARRKFPDILDATTKRRVTVTASNGKIIGIPNTNQDISNIEGAEASKTGFTDMAGGNLAIVVDISVGHPVAIVVLGSTHENRFSDVEILYKALQASLRR